MPQLKEKDKNMCSLPTEIILYIFTYLTARDLIKCRQICHRWRYLIDGLEKTEPFWRRHCVKDFAEIYKVARLNARAGLRWYNIYKSLTLWPRLSLAGEMSDEFACASSVAEEIMDFKVLQNGIIGVHKKGAIIYYDIETLERAKRTPITGNYLQYTENAETIVILSFQLHLHIVRKVIYNPRLEPNASFEYVKAFILVDYQVFYVTLDEDIYIIDLRNDNIASTFLGRCQEGIMCFGHTNTQVHALTYERNILTVANKQLVATTQLGDAETMLNKLRTYNLLENLDWRIYFQWMYLMNRTIPEGPLRDIVVMRSYGDMVFVGSNWGVLRIYHAPNTDDLDLFNIEPIKQYNFMERQDCPVLSDLCPIIQIDVLESEFGHTVIAAMPKKIAVFEYIHTCKPSGSFAVLPYSDAEKSKILKIEEFI